MTPQLQMSTSGPAYSLQIQSVSIQVHVQLTEKLQDYNIFIMIKFYPYV